MFDWLTGNVDPNEVRGDLLKDMHLGQRYFKPGQELYQTGRELVEGRGPILDAMRRQMRTSIYDQSAQTGQNLAMQMSRMGMSPGQSGGEGAVISNILKNRAGENIGQGLLGISQFGMQQGGSMIDRGRAFTGMGSQYLSGANTAAAQQRAQNAANISGLAQQFLSPVLGAGARGLEGLVSGGLPQGFSGLLGGLGGGSPQAFDIGAYQQQVQQAQSDPYYQGNWDNPWSN